MKFEDIINNNNIFLYCGDLPEERRLYTNIAFIGLSLRDESNFLNKYHIKHDITKYIPL